MNLISFVGHNMYGNKGRKKKEKGKRKKRRK
jgi:hypothetical protein